MRQLEKNEVQARLLDLGLAAVNILRNNNIPVFLAYGSLLGCVRHKGFIPWDDDFDLFIFGDDVPAAMRLLHKFLPESMIVFSNEISLSHRNWVHKVGDRSTHVVSNEDHQFYYDDKFMRSQVGLTIDIYPLHFRNRKNIIHSLFIILRRLTEKLLGHQFHSVKKHLVRYYSKLNNKSDILFTEANPKIALDSEDFCEEINICFESCTMPVPKGYENILLKLYGSYEELPPAHERERSEHYTRVFSREERGL